MNDYSTISIAEAIRILKAVLDCDDMTARAIVMKSKRWQNVASVSVEMDEILKKNREEQKQLEISQRKRCPKCGEQVMFSLSITPGSKAPARCSANKWVYLSRTDEGRAATCNWVGLVVRDEEPSPDDWHVEEAPPKLCGKQRITDDEVTHQCDIHLYHLGDHADSVHKVTWPRKGKLRGKVKKLKEQTNEQT